MKKIFLNLMVLGAVGAMAAGITTAIFTAQSKNEGNTFATGTLEIEAGGGTSLPVNFSDLAPGWSASDDLEIINEGSLELRYAMSPAIETDEGEICSQLQVTIIGGNSTLYSGSLADAFFGDPSQGADTGDRILEAGERETLDFEFSLPLETDNEYQGKTCQISFVFDAEQTANNP